MALVDNAEAYTRTRLRVTELVTDLAGEAEATTVPACPDWTIHDLVAHVAGMPTALATGDLPEGNPAEWIDRIVADRRDTPLSTLVEAWAEAEGSLGPIIEGGLLTRDLIVHEQDLRGALGRPGARDSAEVELAMTNALTSLAGPLGDAGLGAIAVTWDGRRWLSHDAAVGWTLAAEPWEAMRTLESRRTADEMAAPAGYAAVIGGHLPLPTQSLQER